MYELFTFIQSNDFETLFREMGAVSRLFDHFYEVLELYQLYIVKLFVIFSTA